MNPRLEVIAGPLQGATYALTGAEIWIGRDPSNNICLSDPLVSRRHCRIAHTPGGFVVRDQQSANGTTINESPMREAILQEGDKLQVGDSVFLFLTREIEASPAIEFEEQQLVTRATISLAQHESIYLQPEKLSTLALSVERAQHLSVILKSSQLFSQLRGLDALPGMLLKLANEAYPMTFGAVMLEQERFPFAEQLVWTWEAPESKSPFPIYRAIVDRALEEKKASLNLVSPPAGPDARTEALPAPPASVLVIPLQAHDITLGVLYQVLAPESAGKGEEQVEVLTALTAQAALALENLRQLEWLAQETRRLQEEIYPKPGLIGISAPMLKVAQQMERVAETDSLLLIRGESGTGKEIVAREIHQQSPRRQKPSFP